MRREDVQAVGRIIRFQGSEEWKRRKNNVYGMALMRKVPHCHRHLNAWLPADGTLLGGLGSMISLEKVCYSRQVLKNLAISSFFFLPALCLQFQT